MRLKVKRGDNLINEMRFSTGPIYIGRQIGSQIFLPDKAVSRQHAVLYTTTEGKWVVEDLDSVNKTYLNDDAIHKAELKEDDILKIADFQIEIHVEGAEKHDSGVSLGETLHASIHEPQIIVRHLDGVNAQVIKMPAKRAKDFSSVTAAICKCLDYEDVVVALLELVFRQLKPFHAWAGLRKNPSGAMEISKGRKISGQGVKFEELYLASRINEAISNQSYIFVPKMPLHSEGEKIGSAIISPIIYEGACFGAIYADSSLDHEHYSLEDLDYLILISSMTGAFVKNL
jgi:hypothetical protein